MLPTRRTYTMSSWHRDNVYDARKSQVGGFGNPTPHQNSKQQIDSNAIASRGLQESVSYWRTVRCKEIDSYHVHISTLQYMSRVYLKVTVGCKCNYSYCLCCECIAWANQTVPGNQYAVIRTKNTFISTPKNRKYHN